MVVIFISGLPGSGKSKLAMEIAKELNTTYGGISTPEIRKGNIRTGFKIVDLLTKEEDVLASMNGKGAENRQICC